MAKRTDSNQASIVHLLREFGAAVWVTSNCGHGAPDLVVSYGGQTFLMEVKAEGGKLTPAEEEWRKNWRGNYYIIHSVEEAVQILIDGMED